MLHANSTDNDTNLANASHPAGAGRNPFEDVYKAAFGSSIFIFPVSFVTILANSLLLLVLCIDPLKIFRNPTTYFLIGLAIVDLLAGLVQEPIYATCFMFLYFQHPLVPKCRPYMRFADYFAVFSATVSLVVILDFTATQYIVVASPLKYGRWVTKKKVIIIVVSIYLYTAIFSCLPLMGVSQEVHNAMTLFFHSHALVLITIVFYILLHHAMKRNMATGNSLQNESTSRKESKHIQIQRNFVRLNLVLLIVSTVCFLPSMIIVTIRLYMDDYLDPYAQNVVTANMMIDNLLYLKFLLNPFVYAWRMPKYRESLNKIVCRKNIDTRESSRNGNQIDRLAVGVSRDDGLSASKQNSSAITLLSFTNFVESPVAVD